MKSRVLVLGSSGMAGHAITLALADISSLEVFDVGPRRKIFGSTYVIDLSRPLEIEKLISDLKPNYIINCIGVLVEESEKRKLEAIWFNAYLPNMLSLLCERGSRKLIQLSTDCVFSGKDGPYDEKSYRNGDRFYDRTKAIGEVASGRDLTIRTSITGPELNPQGIGLFNWFMAQKGKVNGYARVFWSGVMTTELANFIVYVISDRPDLSGIVHYATAGGISKYELLRIFNQTFERGVLINPVDEPEIDKRLFNTRKDFDRNPPGYSEQVEQMKTWIKDHGQIYYYYGVR